MKTGCIINRMKRHVRVIAVLAEDYQRKEMSKSNRPHTDDKLNKLNLICYAVQTRTLKQCCSRGEDISQKTMQQPQPISTDEPGEIKQSSSSQENKQEANA